MIRSICNGLWYRCRIRTRSCHLLCTFCTPPPSRRLIPPSALNGRKLEWDHLRKDSVDVKAAFCLSLTLHYPAVGDSAEYCTVPCVVRLWLVLGDYYAVLCLRPCSEMKSMQATAAGSPLKQTEGQYGSTAVRAVIDDTELDTWIQLLEHEHPLSKLGNHF